MVFYCSRSNQNTEDRNYFWLVEPYNIESAGNCSFGFFSMVLFQQRCCVSVYNLCFSVRLVFQCATYDSVQYHVGTGTDFV